MSPADRGLRGPSRQRGIAAIFAALSLVTLLSAVGLAIDIGQLYYADRNLQRLADLAAIDGTRVLSQCLGSAGPDAVEAEVAASLARNQMPSGVTSVTKLGLRRLDENGLLVFQQSAANEGADSVQVTLSRANPARILPLFAGDEARTLTARAAARSEGGVSVVPVSPADASALGGFSGLSAAAGPYFLYAGVGGAGTTFTDLFDTRVEVADVIDIDTSTAGENLPDLDVPMPVSGLLSDIEAALNAAGDAAAAQAVASYAAAIEAARPGSSVVPAEVLGVDVQGGYDGATVPVGAALDAIAGAVTQGDVIELPPVCDLVPAIRNLPTEPILHLCDTTVRMSIPQPSRPGSSSSSSTPILDVSNETSSSEGRTASGLFNVRLRFANPITGQPIELPLNATITPGTARGVLQSCARLDQPQNIAEVTARGATVQFSLGHSGNLERSLGTPDIDVTRLLDDTVAAPILNVSIGDVLTNAGLGALVDLPLFAGFKGQTIKVSAYVAPIEFGNSRSETFCMQGPPFTTTLRCNGQPASVGGSSAAEIGRVLPDALGRVQLTVELPPNLPLGLSTALQAPVNALTATLSTTLQSVIGTLVPRLVEPLFTQANLPIGQTTVKLVNAGATQPRVYAQ